MPTKFSGYPVRPGFDMIIPQTPLFIRSVIVTVFWKHAVLAGSRWHDHLSACLGNTENTLIFPYTILLSIVLLLEKAKESHCKGHKLAPASSTHPCHEDHRPNQSSQRFLYSCNKHLHLQIFVVRC